MSRASAERSSDKVYLRADGGLAYDGVMQVMGALNAGGFRNIGLVSVDAGSWTTAEIELVELPGRETRLKAALDRVLPEYDFILIDCPPSLSLLTVNALVAAQRVLIPMQCEYYALEGLSDLVGTIKRVRAHLNPELDIAGLLRTMYDPRNTLSQQVSQQLEAHFGEKVYRTLVPRNVRLAEAPSYGVPAVRWDAASKGAQAYLALADEILAQGQAA